MRIALLLLGLCLSSVSCRLQGETVFAKVDTDGKLYGPWLDAEDDGPTLQRPPSPDSPLDTSEVVQVYLDKVFLRYLPDIGLNEVVIVVEVSEDGTNDPTKNYTRVLGPYENYRDNRMLPEEGILVYGPKRLEGDSINITFHVIEIDADERESASAVFDLIGSLAGSFDVANPVGAAEVELASGLGKTLVSMNANDIVISRRVHLYAKDPVLQPDACASPPIPLRPGSYALITRELGYVGTEFFWFTQQEWDDWSTASVLSFPLAVVADVLLLPWNAVQRVFLDSPDHDSLSALTWSRSNGDRSLHDGRNYFEEELSLDPTHRSLLKGGKPYEGKSWLVFSINQGGDPSRWKLREGQRATEARLARIFEDRSLAAVLPAQAEGLARLVLEYEAVRAEADRLAAEARSGIEDPTRTTFFQSEMAKGPLSFVARRPPGTAPGAVADVVTYVPDPAAVAASAAAMAAGNVALPGIGTPAPAVTLVGAHRISFSQQLAFSTTDRYEHDLVIRYGTGSSTRSRLVVVPDVSPAAASGKWRRGTRFTVTGIPDATFSSVRRIDLHSASDGSDTSFGRRLFKAASNAIEVLNEGPARTVAAGDTITLFFDGGLPSVEATVP